MAAPVDAPPWWRRALVYQVYPRSFADGNGDGTGDVEGIRSRLPYLRDLGVDALWISPWYASPWRDGGYDVADFRDISPRFGTLADAERLIAEAHAHGIRIIVDLVPNHLSSDHPWFRAALAAAPGSPERERFVFRDGRDDGEAPPNNWKAVFGGPAWEQVEDGQWYLHLFDPSQPDLNWENEEVRAEFDAIFRFWLDRGVDGFRVDVAHGLVKDPALPDVTARSVHALPREPDGHPFWDRDGVHEIIRRWRAILDASPREVMMVAEAWVHPERLGLYLRPDEYHQSFNFDFLQTPWQLDEVRAAAARGIEAARAVGSTPTWTLSNHDVMRHCTRYGLPADVDWRRWPLEGPHDALDAGRGLLRARAATLLLMALPGSAYVYQGEELGLPEAWDLPEDVLDDPVWENSGRRMKGRDGCRVPLPWTPAGPSLGFGSAAPWLPQPERYAAFAVSAQTDDPDSTLSLYRRAIALRREHLVGDETLRWLGDSRKDTVDGFGKQPVLAFERGSGLRCVVNFGESPIALPEGELLLASAALDDGLLPGDATAWILPDQSAS